jgi:hypothetical protein
LGGLGSCLLAFGDGQVEASSVMVLVCDQS